jgi:hypothetical protein
MLAACRHLGRAIELRYYFCMTTSTIADHSVCPNCDSATSGNYCQHCGQETHLHPASAREFLHEFVGHYVAAENKLWGTLMRLLFRPGALTNEYIRGRRVRFVQPLRLYLTLSVLFFALLKFTHGFEMEDNAADTKVIAQEMKKEAAKKPAAPQKLEKDEAADPDINDFYDHLPSFLVPRVKNFENLPRDKKGEAFTEGLYHYLPTAMFVMLPLFALYLKILYLGSGKRYGEHLLFSLHTNAFAFAIFSAMLMLPFGFLRFVMWLWVIGYLPWAMRRVYQKGRFGTIWRWSVLIFLYSLTMALGFGGAVAAGILTASH